MNDNYPQKNFGMGIFVFVVGIVFTILYNSTLAFAFIFFFGQFAIPGGVIIAIIGWIKRS